MKMRKCYILFLLILTAVVFITHGTAQDTTDNGTETALSADYFEQVTLFSGGRITRFTQMPIRVHISPTLKALPYLERDTLRAAHLGNRYRREDPVPRN